MTKKSIQKTNVQALISRAAEAERFLKAIANRHRLTILCELHKGEAAVGTLQDAVGLKQSTLSQHLARLRDEGLVKTRRSSQTIYYSLANENVARALTLMHELFCHPGPQPPQQ